jgi:peptide-methionine (S)-S-oxide reductase
VKTSVTPLTAFYPAEDYHQNYLDHHPDNSYIIFNDLPKIQALYKTFPAICVRR